MKKEKKLALQFLDSNRGSYIVGRALYETAQRIKIEEPSDAADMKFLGETLFGLGWISAQAFEKKVKIFGAWMSSPKKFNSKRTAS